MVQQLISIFNGKNKTHLRPGGLNFTFVEWFSAKGCQTPGPTQLNKLYNSKREHNHIQEASKEVLISGLVDLDYELKIDGEDPLTPCQVLITMRTSTDWDTTVFTQINQTDDGMVGICHKNEYNEAVRYIHNLYLLWRAFFGQKVDKWFDLQAKEEGNS